jgi:hypothetical protein
MKEVKYIPGDLVMTNGVPLGTAKDVVYRVTSSDPSKTLKLDDGTVLKGVVCLENIEGAEFGEKGYLFGDCCAWVKDIVAIPLTPEILEKNGWKKEMYHDWRHYIPLERTLLYLSRGIDRYRDGAFDVCVGLDMSHIAYISFVHQLQHLFFSLNINYEVEV